MQKKIVISIAVIIIAALILYGCWASFATQKNLLGAVKNNNLGRVRLLLMCRTNTRGLDLLDYAAHANNEKLLELLVRYHVDEADQAAALFPSLRGSKVNPATVWLNAGQAPNASDSFGYTPLMVAVIAGHEEAIVPLVQAGADVNAVNKKEKCSVLDIALRNEGNEKIARLLISKGARMSLANAASLGDIKAMKRMIASGAAVDQVGYMGTPLEHASRAGKLEAVKLLITSGAKVNYSHKGVFPAIFTTHPDVLQYLLSHGGSANARNSDKSFSALHFAALGCDANDVKCAEILLEHGADVNLSTSMGKTPLHTAGCVEVAKVLIAHGADISRKTHDGQTPLHYAAYAGKPELIEFLVTRGADINARDAQGNTPLMYAETGTEIKSVRTLCRLGAKTGIKNEKGETAQKMAEDGLYGIRVELMYAKDSLGYKARLEHHRNELLTIIKVLKQHGAK